MHSIVFSANVYLHKIPDNLSVVEGEKLELHCKAYGSEPITIKWTIGEVDAAQFTIFSKNNKLRFSQEVRLNLTDLTLL